jgi:hypothetical protein
VGERQPAPLADVRGQAEPASMLRRTGRWLPCTRSGGEALGSRVIALATERERAGVSGGLLRLRSRSHGGDAPTLGLSSHTSPVFVLLASAKVPMRYQFAARVLGASYRRERSERTPDRTAIDWPTGVIGLFFMARAALSHLQHVC